MSAPTLQHEVSFDSHPVKHGQERRMVHTAFCLCGCGRHWTGYSPQDVAEQVKSFLDGEGNSK